MARFGRQGHYIHGKPVEADGDTFATVDPASGEVLAEVAQATAADVDRAVDSARTGQAAWAALPAMERARVLRRAVALLRERNDELAELETLDTGKPLSETRAVDIATGADVLEYYAGLAPALEGRQIPLRPTSFVYTRREPLGVVAGIGAWNYPIQIALWKSAPALAAGNAMIFKPSEVTPLTALKLAALYTEAGLPDGVFNVVQGDGRVGALLGEHPAIEKISFTGGVETGKRVMAAAGGSSLKDVTMELGGKSPLIVFADADLDLAVRHAVGQYDNAGQVCLAGTRLLVEAPAAAEFLARFTERARMLRQGDPRDDTTDVGPNITREHLERVDGFVRRAVAAGARPVLGGAVHPELGGLYYQPTLLTGAAPGSEILTEEVFGPVLTLQTFSGEAEAVALANSTRYGLAATLFTGDRERASHVSAQLVAGTVWVNCFFVRDLRAPFGGARQSGIGREGGTWSFDFYGDVKNTVYAPEGWRHG